MFIRGGTDTDALYALFLGRLPEDEFVREKDLGQFVLERVLAIIESEEFKNQVVEGLCRFGVLPHQSLPLVLLPVVRSLITELGLLPAEPGTAITDWKTMLGCVLSIQPCRPLLESRYGEVAQIILKALGVAPPPATEGEAEKSPSDLDIISEVEITANAICRGWIIDRSNPAAVLHVKIKLNGLTTKIVAADEFRRDIQDRCGGRGMCGFTVRLDMLPDARHLSRAFVEISELSQGAEVLPERIVELGPRPVLRIESEIRAELMQLRLALGRIEQSLPRLDQTQSWPLSAYEFVQPVIDLAPSLPRSSGSVSFCVVIIDNAEQPDATQATIESVLAQTHAAEEIFLILADAPANDIDRTSRVQLVRRPSDENVNAAINGIASSAGASRLLVLDAGVTLVPAALAWFDVAVERTRAPVIYADYDQVSCAALRREHVVPVFLPALDRELLLQRNYIGRSFCVARDVFVESDGFSCDPSIDASHDFLLRATERLGRGGLMHLPLILYRSPEREGEGNAQAVQQRVVHTVEAHAAAGAGRAFVVAHDDPLGRAVPDAAKIVWPEDMSSRTSVIILTKDAAELVFALVASLRRHTQDWDRVEIVVVVNGDVEVPKRYAFAEIEKAFDRVKIIYHPVPFNWGAINNTAARDFSDGDFLVFLNDDILCVTPDWDVRLRSQLARADVAVLGGRLLYPNGLIQHAGIVFGHDAQTLHEAAGDPANDGLYLDRTLLVHETAAVTGAFMACRRETFVGLGGFDADRFTITCSDIDFCVRARAAGGSVVYDPALSWIHYESITRGFDGNDDSKQSRFDAEFARWRSGVPELDLVDLTFNPHLVRSPRAFELFHRLGQKAILRWLQAQVRRRATWHRSPPPSSPQPG